MKKDHKLVRMWKEGDWDLYENLNVYTGRPEKKNRKLSFPPAPMPETAKAQTRAFYRLFTVLAVVLCAVLASSLIISAAVMPQFGAVDAPAVNQVYLRYADRWLADTGATNIVAGVILNYRAFDTLGESHVLFAALCAVMLLLTDCRDDRKSITRHEPLFNPRKDVIITQVVKILIPLILVFGIYVVLNGHLSPGGGFSGGTIMGAAFILYAAAFGFEASERILSPRVNKILTAAALIFYSLIKSYSFYTGANHLESFITNGVPGRIVSAGLILPLNIAVGLVVCCTMYGMYSLFKRGRT
ncbi:MAG: hypothetical protein IJP23_01960 [Oscillospiraceae bacterium]|nr:hypothetical protein [Oscillospiraceae bacterium]